MKPIAIFRHAPNEGPGYLSEFFDARQLPWQLIRIDEGEIVPQRADEFSGLVFMGGPMSANDDLPWIENVLALIRDAVARDIPVLGHCLGGQLFSRALGGTVRKNSTREIGWGEVSLAHNSGEKLAEARAWFGEEKNAMAFHWHGETFSFPPGATHLFSSKHCTNQAFALGKHLALQCHVEMTEAMIGDWCEIGADEITAYAHTAGVQSATAMQNLAAQNLPQLNKLADKLYTRWVAGLARE